MSELVSRLTSLINDTERIAIMSPEKTKNELFDIVEELVYIRLRVSMGDAK